LKIKIIVFENYGEHPIGKYIMMGKFRAFNFEIIEVV
jgi:hypothetical protein